jgi:hypothetical protein
VEGCCLWVQQTPMPWWGRLVSTRPANIAPLPANNHQPPPPPTQPSSPLSSKRPSKPHPLAGTAHSCTVHTSTHHTRRMQPKTKHTHKPNHNAHNTTRPAHAAATAGTAPAVKVGVQNRPLGAWQQEYYAATTPRSRRTRRAHHNTSSKPHTTTHEPVQVDPCCNTVVQAA